MLQLHHWISTFVGKTSCQRGYQYFRDGHVQLDTCSSHQGRKSDEVAEVIRAHVIGNVPTPYQVWASISGDTITDSHCSCHIGSDGKCKHVAALLFAAKAGPESAGAKTHIATSPPASSSASQGAPSRQLWNGPFSSTKAMPTTPVSAFRAQISPKKNVWGTSLMASPPSASAPFSVQPGFSLRDPTSLSTHQFTEFPSASQPTSPFKPKQEARSSIYPSPAHSASQTPAPIPTETPHLSQPDTMDVTDASTAQDLSIFTSTTTGASLDASVLLQEELNSSRLYAANLERQCDLLREQVRMLQSQVSRQNAEIAALRQHSEHSSPSHACTSSNKPSPNSAAPQQPHTRPRPSLNASPVVEAPPASVPAASEELRDSIETSSDEGAANPKKRGRAYEAEDKPGLVKRLSFETTTDTVAPAPTSTADSLNASIEVDSQALLAALEQYETKDQSKSTSSTVGAVNLPLSRNATPASSQAIFPVSRAISFDKMTQHSTGAGEQGTPPNTPSPSQGSSSEETIHASKPNSPISHSIAVITQLQDVDGIHH